MRISFGHIYCIWTMLLVLTNLSVSGQCLLESVSLEERAANSSFVFEAEKIGQGYYWSDEEGRVYTDHQLEIQHVFKGESLLSDTVLLRTRGGVWGDLVEEVFPVLGLSICERGLFFANVDASDASILRTCCGPQSFIRYDLEKQSASDPLNYYEQIALDVHLPLWEAAIGMSELDYENSYLFQETDTKDGQDLPPVISGFSPTSITAGTFDILTITGENFGSAPTGMSSVHFRNPDFYGLSFSYQAVAPNHILSWSDNEIQVLVPGRDPLINKSGAGTGLIRVYNEAGDMSQSTENLTVLYNKMTAGLHEIDLVNDSGFGGYTFSLNETLAADEEAVAAIDRALSTWQCEIQTNLVNAGASSPVACAANDGLNLIAFDTSCELPMGTIGQTTHWFMQCADGDAFFLEMDLLFDAEINWNFSTAPTPSGQKDFESAVLHELGHAHGMGHVLDFGKVMYPALLDADDVRELDADAKECGALILAHSVEANTCGDSSPMIALPACDAPCSLSISDLELLNNCDSAIDDLLLYSLTLEQVNASESGFQLFIDGAWVADFDYGAFGSTSIEFAILGDGAVHSISIKDMENPDFCFAGQILPTPLCICTLSASYSLSGGCDNADLLSYTLLIDGDNTSSAYQVFVDGVLYDLFDYSGGLLSTCSIDLAGDGSTHEVLIQDVLETDCSYLLEISTPLCACALSFTATPDGDGCNADESINYFLSIDSDEGSDAGFEVWLDGSLMGTAPYALTGPSYYNLPIAGDGFAHNIEVRDQIKTYCNASNTITTEDCACAISLTLIEEVGTFDCYASTDAEQTWLLEVDATGNSSTSFELWVADTLHGIQNYSSDGTAPIYLSVSANTAEFEFYVVDLLKENCVSETLLLTPPSCDCLLDFTAEAMGDCTPSDSIPYALTIIDYYGGENGLTIALDGAWIDTIAYTATGYTNYPSLMLPADGASHSLIIQDLDDATCSADTLLLMPNCICEMSLTTEALNDCANAATDDLLDYLLHLTYSGTASTSFELLFNGTSMGFYDYELDGTSEIPLSFDGDGSLQNIQIVDVEDASCMASTSINLPNCTCSMSLDISEPSDCTITEELFYELILTSENGSESGFELYIDDLLIGTYLYELSGTTLMSIAVPGDGMTHSISIIDLDDPEACTINQTVVAPNCICDLALTQVGEGFCELSTDSYVLELELSSLNTGTMGFEYWLDGELQSSYAYDADNSTAITLNLPDDGLLHQIEFRDVEKQSCAAFYELSTENCTCQFTDLSYEPIGSCEDGFLTYAFSFNSWNMDATNYQVLLNGSVVDTLNYTGFEQSFSLPLLSTDSNAYELMVLDLNDSDCALTSTLIANSCTCSINALNMTQLSTCEDDPSQIDYQVAINATNPTSAGFRLFVNGTDYFGAAIPYTGTTTLVSISLPTSTEEEFFLISAQDELFDSCNNELEIAAPECACSMSILTSLVEPCDENEQVTYQVNLNSTNLQGSFNVYLDGALTADSPINYTGNSTLFFISLLGDGEVHELLIQDAEQADCSSNTQLQTPICSCSLTTEALQSGPCNDTGWVDYSVLIESFNASATNYEIYLADILFDQVVYMGSTTVSTITLPADGSSYSLFIVDQMKPDCQSTIEITTPDCPELLPPCAINIQELVLGNCNLSGQQQLSFSLSDEQGSSSGFSLWLDDSPLNATTTYAYQPTGMSFVTIDIPCLSDTSYLRVQDTLYPDCFDEYVLLPTLSGPADSATPSVFPNPITANDAMIAITGLPLSDHGQSIQANFYNTAGKRVGNTSFIAAHNNQIALSGIRFTPNEIYLLRLNAPSDQYTFKLFLFSE